MLILIFVPAFLIRLISLDQSLWLDEAITAKLVVNHSFRDIIRQFSPFDFHPPLYYLFLKLWSNIFGYSEISLRLPSVIFSLLTGYLLYLIGKNLYNKTTGLWASIFFLFNPLVIYYSQEARMYLMNVFFIIFSIYFFFKIQNSKIKNPTCNAMSSIAGRQNEKTRSKINFIFFALFLSLSVYTFYGSIFIIISIFLYLFFKKEFKILLIGSLFFLVSVLLISPLIYQQLINSKIQLTEVKNWSLVLGQANLKNLLLIPIKFSVGRISFYPKWLYWLTTGIWTVFVWAIMINKYQISKIPPATLCVAIAGKQNDKTRSKIIFLNYLLFFPIFLGFICSFFTPLLSYFRFLYLVPIFSLLLGISKEKEKVLNWEKLLIISGFFIWSIIYLLNHNFHREDWKGLANYLKNKRQEIYLINSVSDPLKYYGVNPNLIYDLKKIREIELNKFLYVVPYATEIFGIDYQKELNFLNFYLKNKKAFRGIFLEEWERRKID